MPLLLLLSMWVHIQRLSHPDTQPGDALTWGTLAALVALSLIRPVVSGAPADLTRVTTELPLDWFYLAPNAAIYAWSPGTLWAGAAAITLLLLVCPLLPHPRRAPVAQVDAANCNGCGRCFADCPYSAVVMQPRTDGRSGGQIAGVDADLCAACGICADACPSSTPFRSAAELVSGIDMPQLPVGQLRSRLKAQIARDEGALETHPEDAPQFADDGSYFDLTVRLFAQAGLVNFPGYGLFPTCYLFGSEFEECGAGEYAVRHSFLRRDPDARQYVPMPYKGAETDLFGFFTADRMTYDPLEGVREQNKTRNLNRHNMWVDWYDASTCTAAPDDEDAPLDMGFVYVDTATVCREIPVPERTLRPIVYFVNTDFPDDLEVGEWHSLVSYTASRAYFNPPVSTAVRIDCAFTFVRPQNQILKTGEIAKGSPLYPTGRRSKDLYKLLRWICDALTGVVYVDDCQVFEACIGKYYGLQPGCLIRVFQEV